LQFQDITAQQIKGAYSLLHDTEKTLIFVANLLKEFELGENQVLVLPDLDKNSFNAGAVFSDKANIQGAIDDLFNTGDVNVDIPNDEGRSVPRDASPVDSATGGSDDDFDIDALFNKSNVTPVKEETANQDDIDALFS
jgi:hypothetical protein